MIDYIIKILVRCFIIAGIIMVLAYLLAYLVYLTN